METATHESVAIMREATATQRVFTPPFPPLAQVTKPNLTTVELAYYLNRRPQTLRGWACHEDGPIRPRRINGRLAWPVSEIKRLLGVKIMSAAPKPTSDKDFSNQMISSITADLTIEQCRNGYPNTDHRPHRGTPERTAAACR